MRRDFLVKVLAVSFAGFLVSSIGPRQVWGAAECGNQQNTASELQEVSVNLTRLPEDPSKYSLVLSDADERVISGSFSVNQLQILRAIMTEADKFAISSEGVGAKDPITTRFSDKQEKGFLVEVQKTNNVSMLFLTIKTETGEMRWTAGRVIRSTRRDEGFFFDLLTRLDAVLPKEPVK